MRGERLACADVVMRARLLRRPGRICRSIFCSSAADVCVSKAACGAPDVSVRRALRPAVKESPEVVRFVAHDISGRLAALSMQTIGAGDKPGRGAGLNANIAATSASQTSHSWRSRCFPSSRFVCRCVRNMRRIMREAPGCWISWRVSRARWRQMPREAAESRGISPDCA